MFRKRGNIAVATAAALTVAGFGFAGGARAADVWWDLNGETPGASDGTTATGNWNTTDANWSTDPTGSVATQAYVAGDHVHFSAGTNATGSSTITAAASLSPGAMTLEEGTIVHAGSPINMGANPVRINQGATLQLSNLANVTVAAGHVLTLDGGTIRNTIAGVGSGIYPSTNAQIQLTSNGGTIDIPTAGSTVYLSPITLAAGTTSATVTKTGIGEFRGLTNWGFTTLNVNQGLYRINGNGGSDTGFGVVTGTINVADGAAVGTSITITSPATRSIVLGAGATGATFVLNASWTVNGVISGAGGLSVNGNGFTGTAGNNLTLAGANTYGGPTTINSSSIVANGGSAIPDGSAVTINTAAAATANLTINGNETIGSLAGGNDGFGITTIATGQTLTTGGNGGTTNYAGRLAGAGNLVKTGAGQMTIAGGVANTRTGTTAVNAGTLVLAKTAGNAVTGNVTVGDGSATAATLSLGGSNQIADAATVTVNGSAATFAIGTNTETVAGVALQAGSITGSGAGVLTSAGAYDVQSGSASASLAGAVPLNKTTAGTVTLSGANTYTGGTTVSAGTLVAANANAFNTGQALAVSDGATARVQTGVATAIDVATLTVAPTGRVDLNDGALVKRNASGAAGQTATQQITALLKTGLENGGNFDLLGPGISSTEANADNATAGSFLFALGVVQNNLAVAGSPDGTTTDETPGAQIYTTFKGRTAALNDTLVRYTYMGDADLSGDVTSTDYSLIDAGFGGDLAGWVNGDFDYSGEIDSTDYALIDNAFGAQTGVLPEQVAAMIAEHTALFGQEYVDALAAVQAVPEPGTLGVLALAGVGLLARRRRAK